MGLRLQAPPTTTEGLSADPTAPLTLMPPTSPYYRSSGPGPTAEATPARHLRSFIVDSKLPKWRRLVPPRKPPPAPTQPLAATTSASAPLWGPLGRAARARDSPDRPALPPPLPALMAPPKSPPGLSSLGSSAPSFARRPLPPCLAPGVLSWRQPQPRLLLHTRWRELSRCARHGVTASPASRQENRDPGSSLRGKWRAVLAHPQAPAGARVEAKLKGKYGSSQKGEGCFFHS